MAAVESVKRQLDNILKNDLPFATSRAMEITIKKAVDKSEQDLVNFVKREAEGAKGGSDSLNKGLAAKGHNRGAIRGQWATKKEIQRSKIFADAKVFIVNNQSVKGGKDFDLIDEFHPLVFGGRASNVPQGANTVLTPTSALLKGMQGQGRLKALNTQGNINRLKQKILSELKRDPKRYLNVPINNPDPKLAHLPPGLYWRGREKSKGGFLKVGWRYEDGRLSRAKKRIPSHLTRSRAVGKRGRAKRAGGRIVNYLVMLIAYHKRREYDAQWNFPAPIQRTYQECFPMEMRKQLAKAVSDSSRKFKR